MDLNIDNFPVILREKLKSEEISLPEAIETEYSPIRAYRCVRRSIGENRAIDREDMRSQAELGIKPRFAGGDNNPDYYSTSFFTSLEVLYNTLKLPHPTKRCIVGNVFQEGGPCFYNRDTTHVSWWMYENVDISNFIFLEENNE